MLDALTLVSYLPAWIVAIGALIARCWWLAADAAEHGRVGCAGGLSLPVRRTGLWRDRLPYCLPAAPDGCQVRSVRWDGQWEPYMVEATWWTPGGPVALRLVHTLAPLPVSWREWAAALAAVDQSVHASGTSNMLMIGDFNATWDNRGFIALLDDGLTR